MKKLCLSLCLVAGSLFSYAQIDKRMLLSGNDYDFGWVGNHTSATTIDWLYGLAIKDDLVLGVCFSLGTFSSNGALSTYETNYEGGVFLRKYVYLGSHFSLFGQSMLAGSSDIQTTDHPVASSPYTENANGYIVNLGLSPGVVYTLNRFWQFEILLPNLVSARYGNASTDDLLPPGVKLNPHLYVNGFNITSSLANSAVNFGVGMIILFERPAKKERTKS